MATVHCFSAFWPRSSAGWLLCPFDVSITFLEHFLIFWHKMFRGHFVFFLTPENYLFLQRGLFLCRGEWHLESNIMAVGMLNATVFASSPLHGIEVKKKKKKIHVSYTYLRLLMSPYRYLQFQLSVEHTWFPSCSPPFRICPSFLLQ